MVLSNNAGTSLIEVLAALLIVALVTASVLGLFRQGLLWNRGAALRTQSIAYGQAVIEEFRAHPDYIKINPDGAAAGLSTDIEPPPGIESRVYINSYDSNLLLYQIEVDLAWKVEGGTEREKLIAVLQGVK